MLINVLCAASHVLCTKILGWKFVGDRPPERKVMLLGAPHTSNLDYFLTLALIHHWQLPLRYLVKDNIFKGPLAFLLKSLGGILLRLCVLLGRCGSGGELHAARGSDGDVR